MLKSGNQICNIPLKNKTQEVKIRKPTEHLSSKTDTIDTRRELQQSN